MTPKAGLISAYNQPDIQVIRSLYYVQSRFPISENRTFLQTTFIPNTTSSSTFTLWYSTTAAFGVSITVFEQNLRHIFPEGGKKTLKVTYNVRRRPRSSIQKILSTSYNVIAKAQAWCPKPQPFMNCFNHSYLFPYMSLKVSAWPGYGTKTTTFRSNLQGMKSPLTIKIILLIATRA